MQLHKKAWAVLKARVANLGYGSPEQAMELEVLADQFSRLGLDYRHAKMKTKDLVVSGALTRSDTSLHYELFAAIAAVHAPRRILEIGTFRGEFSAFLATLFPKSNIETWDLPNTTSNDMHAYVSDLASHYNDQQQNRVNNLNRHANVHQVLKDSTYLTRETAAFDLIWVDGDHSYPVVAFDILNAVRLAAPGAWIVLDDIKLTEMRRSSLSSTEAFECINHLTRSGMITSSLVYKRVGSSGRRWRDEVRRKHLAVLRSNPS
jgi:predicted O-methyltransferase YrrM